MSKGSIQTTNEGVNQKVSELVPASSMQIKLNVSYCGRGGGFTPPLHETQCDALVSPVLHLFCLFAALKLPHSP